MFYKEYRLLLNRIKSYLFAVLMGYVLILIIMWLALKEVTNAANSANILIIYTTIYMGFLSFLYLMRFWEEKIAGTMEYSFVLYKSIKRIIFLKNIVYLLIGFFFLVVFFAISSIIFLKFSIFNLAIATIAYVMLVFPYGLVNGSGMWCLKSGAAKVIQLVSMGIIFSSIGLIWKATDVSIMKFYLPAFLMFDGILWIIGVVLFLRADKEKAISRIVE